MLVVCQILMPTGLQAEPMAEPGTPFLLSTEGSGRATAYVESPKIITFKDKTHVAWLDSPEEGFRVRIRTLDHSTGQWSETWTLGEAENNHGGPALTVDGDGYLHVLYYSHHHPFRYRRSIRPNDASSWTDYAEFGEDLTYPALLCARDGTLILTARRSYADRPWELEMWRKPPDKPWQRQGPLLRSRYTDYAQFAASLAWGPDHSTLHMGMRVYEMPEGYGTDPLTTVGYMSSRDGGLTWSKRNGKTITLPATAETFEVIASGKGREGRVLNAGSIGVDPQGKPHVPYSVRIQDSSQAYLASPMEDGRWRHLHLNPFLPPAFREGGLFMHGGVAFGKDGQPMILATVMDIGVDGIAWGDLSTEVVSFRSNDHGRTLTGEIAGMPDPDSPRWLPNIERPTGYNEMTVYPGFIYTDGVRGDTLGDRLSNRVWWVPGRVHRIE